PQRRVRRGRVSESAGDLEPDVVVGQGTGQIIGRGLDGGDAEPAQARSQRCRRQQLRLGRGGRVDLLDIAACPGQFGQRGGLDAGENHSLVGGGGGQGGQDGLGDR